MIKKLFSIFLLFTNLFFAFANNSPILSNFRIEDSDKTKVYFDSSEPITGSNVTGFYLSDNRRKTVTGVTIAAGATTGHYFTASSAFDYWDTYALRYEGGSDLQDLDGNVLHEFWLTEIRNNIPEPAPSGTAYWVRTTGDDSNDGLSHETAFRTINAAISIQARTIYVEAGDYGAETMHINYSGTSTQPIVVQGYKTQTNGVPDEIEDNYWSWGAYGVGVNCVLDTSEMPTLTGNPTLRNTYSSAGWAIDPTDYIIIKNFQTTQWNMGARIVSSDHLVMKNTVHIYNGRANGDGRGGGIWVVGGQGQGNDMYNKFINIEIAQSASVGLRLYGGGSWFENVNVYNDIAEDYTFSSPDYYLHVYQGSNNVMIGCSVAEIGVTPGSSHGIGFKGSGSNVGMFRTQYNLITDCTIRNMQGAIEMRHEDVQHNVARNVTIFSLPEDGAVSGSGNNSHGIVNRDNASFNKFENITLDSQYRAIYFTDSSEQGAQTSAHSCTFRNIIVTNSKDAIGTSGNSGQPPVYNNHFYNLTIDNCDRLWMTNGPLILNNSNSITNSSISNVNKQGTTSIVQSHNNYHNNGFNPGSGTSITTHDPMFVSPAANNYRLQPDSPIRDIGKDLPEVRYDLDGTERYFGKYSIGAFDDTVPAVGSVGPDVTICEGESTTLVASGGTSYSWSTGETTETITVNPTSTTTYSVTISDGTNSDTYDIEVTVDAAPTVDAGADQAICEGETITLTATGIGNFLWSTGETTESITVSPTSTTTYTVTTSNSCSTDATDDVVVTVNPSPNLNAGADVSVCEGESVTLTATGTGPFSWSTGETTASITVSPASTTIYTVVSDNGNCSETDQVEVEVNTPPSVDLGSDQTICEGQSITLTASGYGNFLWSTGETAQSITVSPSSTTTYSVTASNSCSSSATDDIVVTVNPSTNLNAGDDQSICQGETVTLTATGTGPFSWSTGATTASITVSPNSTTSYSVTSDNGSCSETDEVVVTVNTPPSVDAGSDRTICEGESVTLTATGNGDFLWSTGETGPSITVSPTSTSTYSVTTTSQGCQSTAVDFVDVIVGELPDLTTTNDVIIQRGQSITLEAMGTGNFVWNTGATTPSITVSPLATTDYTVTLTSEGGCSNKNTITVTVEEAADGSNVVAYAGEDTSICSGDEIVLTASGGDSFLWNTGETTRSITVSPNESTIYSVQITVEDNSDTAYVKVTVDGSCAQATKEMVVYPIPTHGLLNIDLLGYDNNTNVMVYDARGNMVWRETINNQNGVTKITRNIDLSRLAKGVYFISVTNKGEQSTKRIVLM